jgi:ammonia channel protein AmtB
MTEILDVVPDFDPAVAESYTAQFSNCLNMTDGSIIRQPGPSSGGIIGNTEFMFFKGIGAKPFGAFAATIPGTVFFVYQLMFAVITPALITGAIAERANFPAYLLFMVLWHFCVYCPTAHMVWHPDGLLRKFGILDFAGGWLVCSSIDTCSVTRAALMPLCEWLDVAWARARAS